MKFSLFSRKVDPIRLQRALLKAELEAELRQVQMDMNTAYSQFDQVTDPELIDSCIYEVNAGWKRYSYLLRKIQTL